MMVNLLHGFTAKKVWKPIFFYKNLRRITSIMPDLMLRLFSNF